MPTVVYTIARSRSMPADDILTKLLEIPFFARVKTDWLRRLVKDDAVLGNYEAGTLVFNAGQYGDSIFILLRGSVILQLPAGFSSEDGRGDIKQVAVPIKVLSQEGGSAAPGVPWDRQQVWFGESALFGDSIRPYSVQALEHIQVLELKKIHIERLSNLAGPELLEDLRHHANTASIELYLLGHRAFANIAAKDMKAISANSSLRVFNRGQEIFSQGARSKSVFMVKSGLVQLSRASNTSSQVLGYYSAGDIVGTNDEYKRDAHRRVGSLIAMGFVELIEVPRKVFDEVAQSSELRHPNWRSQFNKVAEPQEPNTQAMFVKNIIQDGAHFAQSLMIIDLDLCIRCGNCVRACESRHDTPKMVRRGEKLRRRLDEGLYQEVMLTSSCRHCESPECMVGCPTGAIHREATGEVAVHDYCIGCSNCALRCPWDNITMMPLFEPEERKEYGIIVDRKASKCDLCFGYTEANCVNNCPTEAILRVNPREYFDELGDKAGGSDRKIGNETRAAAKGRSKYSRIVIWGTGTVIAIALWLVFSQTQVVGATTPVGIFLGFVALGCFIAASGLAARRRIAHVGKIKGTKDKKATDIRSERAQQMARGEAVSNTGLLQLGAFHWWAKSHVMFGFLGLYVTLLHANFRAESLLTQLILGLLFLEVLSGSFGVLYSKWVPRVTTRLEREAQLEEDVAREQHNVTQSVDGIVDISAASSAPKVKALISLPMVLGLLFSQAKGTEKLRSDILSGLDTLSLGMSKSALENLGEKISRLIELRTLRILYNIRRIWLGFHIGLSTSLLTVVAVHVFFGLQIVWALR